MALSDRERERYARHLLLPEIGIAGQERLVAGRVRVPAGADAGALAVCREYLERAGLQITPEGERVVPVADAAAVAKLAGQPALVEAARALAGALAAVEAIKSTLELGSPLAGAYECLSSEDV